MNEYNNLGRTILAAWDLESIIDSQPNHDQAIEYATDQT
jgi:hypothetical protein